MKDFWEEFGVYIKFCTAGILVVVVVSIAASYFEMKAFNKFSETKATLGDAIFAELRIFADK